MNSILALWIVLLFAVLMIYVLGRIGDQSND